MRVEAEKNIIFQLRNTLEIKKELESVTQQERGGGREGERRYRNS
jgi:hypothetical protein